MLLQKFWSVFEIITSENVDLSSFCFFKCEFNIRILRIEKFKKLITILFRIKQTISQQISGKVKHHKTATDLTITFHKNP